MSIKDLAKAQYCLVQLENDLEQPDKGSAHTRERVTRLAGYYFAQFSDNYRDAFLSAIQYVRSNPVDPANMIASLPGQPPERTEAMRANLELLEEMRQDALRGIINGEPVELSYRTILTCWRMFMAYKLRGECVAKQYYAEAYELASKSVRVYTSMVSNGGTDGVELVKEACSEAYKLLTARRPSARPKKALTFALAGEFGFASFDF